MSNDRILLAVNELISKYELAVAKNIDVDSDANLDILQFSNLHKMEMITLGFELGNNLDLLHNINKRIEDTTPVVETRTFKQTVTDPFEECSTEAPPIETTGKAQTLQLKPSLNNAYKNKYKISENYLNNKYDKIFNAFKNYEDKLDCINCKNSWELQEGELIPEYELNWQLKKFLKDLNSLRKDISNSLDSTKLLKDFCLYFELFNGENKLCLSSWPLLLTSFPVLINKARFQLLELGFSWTGIIGPIVAPLLTVAVKILELFKNLTLGSFDCIIRALRLMKQTVIALDRVIASYVEQAKMVGNTLSMPFRGGSDSEATNSNSINSSAQAEMLNENLNNIKKDSEMYREPELSSLDKALSMLHQKIGQGIQKGLKSPYSNKVENTDSFNSFASNIGVKSKKAETTLNEKEETVAIEITSTVEEDKAGKLNPVNTSSESNEPSNTSEVSKASERNGKENPLTLDDFNMYFFIEKLNMDLETTYKQDQIIEAILDYDAAFYFFDHSVNKYIKATNKSDASNLANDFFISWPKRVTIRSQPWQIGEALREEGVISNLDIDKYNLIFIVTDKPSSEHIEVLKNISNNPKNFVNFTFLFPPQETEAVSKLKKKYEIIKSSLPNSNVNVLFKKLPLWDTNTNRNKLKIPNIDISRDIIEELIDVVKTIPSINGDFESVSYQYIEADPILMEPLPNNFNAEIEPATIQVMDLSQEFEKFIQPKAKAEANLGNGFDFNTKYPEGKFGFKVQNPLAFKTSFAMQADPMFRRANTDSYLKPMIDTLSFIENSVSEARNYVASFFDKFIYTLKVIQSLIVEPLFISSKLIGEIKVLLNMIRLVKVIADLINSDFKDVCKNFNDTQVNSIVKGAIESEFEDTIIDMKDSDKGILLAKAKDSDYVSRLEPNECGEILVKVNKAQRDLDLIYDKIANSIR